jgi:hypothetical protein
LPVITWVFIKNYVQRKVNKNMSKDDNQVDTKPEEEEQVKGKHRE